MKILSITILFLASIHCFSQDAVKINFSSLDSSSAENIYMSSTESHVVTMYHTTEGKRYILFFNNSKRESFVFFNSEKHLKGFLSATERSISLNKKVTWKTDYDSVSVEGITQNVAAIYLNGSWYGLNRNHIAEILKQLEEYN